MGEGKNSKADEKRKPVPFDEVVKRLLDAPPARGGKPKAKRAKSK